MSTSINEADVLKLVALLKQFLAPSFMTCPAKMPRKKWIAEQRIVLVCLAYEFHGQLGKEMRQWRAKYKLEPAEVAEMLDVSRNWLQGMESGFRPLLPAQMALVAIIFNQNFVTMVCSVLERCLSARDEDGRLKRG